MLEGAAFSAKGQLPCAVFLKAPAIVVMTLVLDLVPLLSLVPASLQALRREPRQDALFWATMAIAAGGLVARVAVHIAGPWQTGFAASLWATLAVSALLYGGVAAITAQAWRLAPLLAGYLFLLGLIAVVWQAAPGPFLDADPRIEGWMSAHIAVSVVTYGLVTIAAVAALAAFVQERALKRRRPTTLARILPSVADCEFLVVRLLMIGEAVLCFGLVTGMVLAYRETGQILPFDHKTVFTVAAFVVIAGMLVAHYRSGMRGRRAARMVLLAYLLLTLGYPGVKFVTDVLMA
jgi:ABC-type uncharacterized transport system permease subunit